MNGEHPMTALCRSAATGERLPVPTVERLHRLLGGDARVEDMVLRFSAGRYGARSLVFLPARVAEQILKRPADFIRAAKQHCEPEMRF
jgi:hypothetical protein